MTATGLKDHHVSDMTGVSRSHISRIRRGKSGANKALALRLQALTKIGWEHFIEPKISIPTDLKKGAGA
jgi:transcriptional regulator with XRE-family HTH domain